MTVKEVKTRFDGQYNGIEEYKFRGQRRRIHSDSIQYLTEDEVVKDNMEPAAFSLMKEADYQNTIMAGASIPADFESWYGSRDAMVLVFVFSAEALSV